MLMSANGFSETYNIPRDTVDSWCMHKKTWIHKKDKHLFVDVDAYFNRIYSMQDVRIKAQNYYYYFTYVIGVYATFITERLSKQIGGSIATWNTFISYTIFKDMDNKRDSERLNKFIKWCEDDRNAYKYGAYMCVSGSQRNKDFFIRLREMV